MNNLNLIQFLKTKVMLLTYFIVCSIFICEKVLAATWGKECCLLSFTFPASDKAKPNFINIHFKFFEYNLPDGIDNSYIENFEAYYSLDNGKSYFKLMCASTENQTHKTWARILLTNKNKDASIKFRITSPNFTRSHIVNWGDFMNLQLQVKNRSLGLYNETWLWMEWYLIENQSKVTHILIKAKFHTPEMMKNDFVDWVYDVSPKKSKLNSDSL